MFLTLTDNRLICKLAPQRAVNASFINVWFAPHCFTHPHAYDSAAKFNCSPIIISRQYTLATSAGCQWKCSQVNLNKPRGAVTVETDTLTAESWASLLLEYCVLASEKGRQEKEEKSPF